MIYFTSDLHFGEMACIKYFNRPFEFSNEGAIQFDCFIRNKYCSLVKDEDIVFFLGDVGSFNVAIFEEIYLNEMAMDDFYEEGSLPDNSIIERSAYIKNMISSLPGQKILIKGNHDEGSNSYYRDCGFLDIKHYLVFDDFFLCHYPLTERKKEIKPIIYKLKYNYATSPCTSIIHGHSHNKSPYSEVGKTRYNVCVDNPATNYMPVTIEGIPEDKIYEYVSSLSK